jgi:sulfate adenylyltransferase subunit 1 (EFTu-like GTPase family)
LVLDTDLDVSRGAVLATRGSLPVKAIHLDTSLVWLSEIPFDPSRSLLLRSAADLVPLADITITAHIDLDTFSPKPAKLCSVNDIVTASVGLSRPAALDPFREHPETGSFLLIDMLTGATFAAGIVIAASGRETAGTAVRPVFTLTREMLARGLCADLAGIEGNEPEFTRRALEAVRLLEAAGVAAIFDGDG